MVRKENMMKVEGLAGGKGIAYVYHVVSETELLGHGRLYARVVLKPNSSVGYHQHVDETEPYLILKGNGVFIDNDGRRIDVGPGDVCTIEVGESHGLENNSDDDLEFMALIHKA